MVVPSTGPAETIYARESLACAIRVGGGLHCWGRAGHDLTYNPTGPWLIYATPRFWPTNTGIAAFSDLAQGEVSACAIEKFTGTTGGPVRCWGGNNGGSLGNGITAGGSTPSTVVGLNNAVQVSGHHTLVLAVRADGTLVRWGNPNDFSDATGTPTVVTGLPPVKKVATGSSHYCALTTAGQVYCSGSGFALGNGIGADSSTPVLVSGLTGVKDIVACNYNTCAVTNAGSVYCWGERLTVGTPSTTALTPELQAGVANVVSLAITRGHRCAANASGSVSCWGFGTSGELGRGGLSSDLNPGNVVSLPAAVQVAVGVGLSCARTAAGAVYCWGETALVGNAAATGAATPTPVLVNTF